MAKNLFLINLHITKKLGYVIKSHSSLILHIILPVKPSSNCFKSGVLFILFVNVSQRAGLTPLYKHIIIFCLSLILLYSRPKHPF